MIFYESPYPRGRTLEELAAMLGADRRASVARELTKIDEETVRGTLESLAAHYREHTPKGEIVIIIAGRK